MKKALSLILALVMVLSLTVPAFAAENDKSGDTTITATKAEPFSYKISFPTEVAEITAAGVYEVGQAKVTNVVSATDKTVISYTATTTDFKCSGKSDLPATYYTEQAATNAFPTDAVTVYEKEGDAASIPTMWVKITEDAWNAAAAGTYTATVTFNFSAEEVEETAAEKISIGGKIFHIVEGNNGATYHFYSDEAGTQEITGWTDVASLSTAKFYSVEGTPTFDKFYEMGTKENGDPLTVSGEWGDRTTAGITTDTVGAGKSNTDSLITSYGTVDGTVWKAIADLRATDGGHNDWFVGTKAEQEKLIASGVAVDLYESDIKLWSSVEFNYETAWFYDKNWDGHWNNSWWKDNGFAAVVLRAF